MDRTIPITINGKPDPSRAIRVRSGTDTEVPAAEVIDTIDRALHSDGNLLQYGDLSAGLAVLADAFLITVTIAADHFSVDLSPHSGEGHDFTFTVDRRTSRIDPNSICVGELEPEPED